MAVSIDTVYQRVLAFANKEQRGYITPQEFNIFAENAQLEIFEQYFYDLAQIGAKAIGKKDCGCKKRQQALNKAFPYKTK